MDASSVLQKIFDTGDARKIRDAFSLPVDIDNAQILEMARAELGRISRVNTARDNLKWHEFAEGVLRGDAAITRATGESTTTQIVTEYNAAVRKR